MNKNESSIISSSTVDRYHCNRYHSNRCYRTFRDLLRWMKGVEEMLEIITEEEII